jgi:hypothetical protein
VAGDDARLGRLGEQRGQLLVGRHFAHDRGVVARSGVDVERVVEHDGERQRGEPLGLSLVEPLEQPVEAIVGRELLVEEPVGVAADHVRIRQRADALDHLTRLRRPGRDVPADHNRLDALALDLGQHRFERREVPVDVVKGGDPQFLVPPRRRSNVSTGRFRRRIEQSPTS